MKNVVYSGANLRAKFAKYYGMNPTARDIGFVLWPDMEKAKLIDSEIVYTVTGIGDGRHEITFNRYRTQKIVR
jgi:hypothetical protein